MKWLRLLLAYHILGSLEIATKPLPSPVVQCQKIVNPLDVTPIRSPQAVHTALTGLFQGKDVVEFGTRSGDGAECFAHVARTLTALEPDIGWCGRLSKRLHMGNVSVLCTTYQNHTPDADLYTWWQQGKGLRDAPALVHLVNLSEHHRIRPGARAVVLFEQGNVMDMRSYKALWQIPLVKSRWKNTVHIPFNEVKACTKAKKHLANEFKKDKTFCNRAKGSFAVGIFTL